MFYCTSLLNESFFSFKIMSNMLFLVRYRSFQWVFKWVSILFWNTFVMSSAKYSQNNIHSWNSDSTFIHLFYLLSSNWCFDTNEPKKNGKNCIDNFMNPLILRAFVWCITVPLFVVWGSLYRLDRFISVGFNQKNFQTSSAEYLANNNAYRFHMSLGELESPTKSIPISNKFHEILVDRNWSLRSN